MRLFVVLLLVGVAAAEGPEIEAHLHDKFVYLERGAFSDGPTTVEHAMAAEGVEAHFLFVFRFGLYSIGRRGDVAPATAGVHIEFNDATRATGPGNPMRPAFLQADLNGEWLGRASRPGAFVTSAASNRRLERRIIVRFARKGRYRLRIRGLFDDSAVARRVPILSGIAEVPDLPGAPAKEADEAAPEPALVTRSSGPPCDCPFCGARLGGNLVRIDDVRHYHCGGCSGAVHVDSRGRYFADVLENGRRRRYELKNGRAAGYVAPPPKPREDPAISRRRRARERNRVDTFDRQRRDRAPTVERPRDDRPRPAPRGAPRPIWIPRTFGSRLKNAADRRRPSRSAASRVGGRTTFVRPANAYGRPPVRKIAKPRRIPSRPVRRIAMPRRIR